MKIFQQTAITAKLDPVKQLGKQQVQRLSELSYPKQTDPKR